MPELIIFGNYKVFILGFQQDDFFEKMVFGHIEEMENYFLKTKYP